MNSLLLCVTGSFGEESDEFSEPPAGIFFSCLGSTSELDLDGFRETAGCVAFPFDACSFPGIACGGWDVGLLGGVSRMSFDFERSGTACAPLLTFWDSLGIGSRTSFLGGIPSD